MAEEKRSNQNVMNALCYVPFVAIVLFFMEPKDKVTPDYKRNMMYGIIFFVVSCLLSIFLIWILKGFVALAYI
ncbi:MAG: hypothetical protein LBC61_03310 [Candidatus Peribacteria bacterium]|jgi:hypothetical protein|nr:hypothetical protein [Candidatus Peribacteria bacterium]